VCWAGLRRKQGAGLKITSKRGRRMHCLLWTLKFISAYISGMKHKTLKEILFKGIKIFHDNVDIKC
jgi:hypothetical protein